MKRNISIIVMLNLILLFMLSGCAKKGEASEAMIVYYLNSSETGLYSEQVFVNEKDGEKLVEELLNILSRPSEKLLYKNALGKQFELLDYSLTKEQLVLNLSEEYKDQDRISEILNRAAIVKTLGQIDSVSGISFLVNGSPLLDSVGNPVGVMTPDMFIVNAGKEIDAYEQADIVLYLANEEGNGLRKVKRKVVFSANTSMDRLIVDELIKGPINGEDAYPVVDSGIKVISTTTTDGICYVSLSAEFMSQTTMVTPEVTIYAIVNSIIELPNINKVQISIDGDTSMVFKEVMPLSVIYERDLEIIE